LTATPDSMVIYDEAGRRISGEEVNADDYAGEPDVS
jgi:hypothetical protein